MKFTNPHQEAYEQRRFADKLWEHADEQCIYDNRREPLLMRVSIFLAVMFILCTYYSLTMSNDEFSSRASGFFWRSVFIIQPAIMLGCMFWLSGQYVLRVDVLPGRQAKIKTWQILGGNKEMIWRSVDFKQQASHHKGQFVWVGSPIVDAPYLTFRTTSGRRLLIDMQGDFPWGINAVLGMVGRNVVDA